MNRESRIRNITIQQFRASVLVMTLIIGSGIMIVSAEFALFVVSSIRQARSIDQSVIASYAAESGIESGLYQVRKEGVTSLRKVKSADGEFPIGMSWTLENTGSATRFKNSITKLEKSLLLKNETVEFGLYKVDGNGMKGVENLKSLLLTWASSPCPYTDQCDGTPNPQFEITIVVWDEGTINWSSAKVVKEFLDPGEEDNRVILPISELIDSDRPMLIRVKALFRDVQGSVVTIHSDLGANSNPLEIPNYFLFQPEGVSNAISQSIQRAIVPGKETAGGIYDFVLFSEEQVTKGGGQTQ
ncbi:hypothetical protein HYV71_00095 [Candidatus Uhrbacteria bacterium]|nr:hypothetical protein [Candidatus Uhrbacteria bacterium]